MIQGKDEYEKYINQFLMNHFPNTSDNKNSKGPLPEWVIEALTYAGIEIYDRNI